MIHYQGLISSRYVGAAPTTCTTKSLVKALDKKERAETTFVFVTPRRWAGKDAWATRRFKIGH
jgi:hypothetical protein